MGNVGDSQTSLYFTLLWRLWRRFIIPNISISFLLNPMKTSVLQLKQPRVVLESSLCSLVNLVNTSPLCVSILRKHYRNLALAHPCITCSSIVGMTSTTLVCTIDAMENILSTLSLQGQTNIIMVKNTRNLIEQNAWGRINIILLWDYQQRGMLSRAVFFKPMAAS